MATETFYNLHLVIDPHPKATRYHGYLGPGLAVFAQPSVGYPKLWGRKLAEPISDGRLFAAFLDAVCKRLEQPPRDLALETAISHVVEAAREAFSRFPDADAAEIVDLSLSLVCFPEAGGLKVLNIGSNVVLRISSGQASMVVEPHSPLYDPEHASSPDIGKLASVSTAVLEPQLRYADELRAAEIELRPGEWLVAAPGSSVAKDLRLSEQPATVAELRSEVIDRLAAPYPGYNRSWLAIESWRE